MFVFFWKGGKISKFWDFVKSSKTFSDSMLNKKESVSDVHNCAFGNCGQIFSYHALNISSLLNSSIENPTANAINLEISKGVDEIATVSLSRISLPLKLALLHLLLAFLEFHRMSTLMFLDASCKLLPNRTLLKNFHIAFWTLD